jgi:hypothetical protein
LQEHRPHSFSGGIDGRPSREYSAEKIAGERRQNLIHDHADRAQRVILTNPSFEVDIAE